MTTRKKSNSGKTIKKSPSKKLLTKVAEYNKLNEKYSKDLEKKRFWIVCQAEREGLSVRTK